MKASVNDDGVLLIETEGGSWSVKMHEVFDALDEGGQMALAESVGWGRVFDYVIGRLKGTTESWAGDDTKRGVELLAGVEEHLLSGYYWSFLNDVMSAAREMRYESAVLNFLRWGRSGQDSDRYYAFERILKDAGFGNSWEYTDEQFVRFTALVKAALRGMLKGRRSLDEAFERGRQQGIHDERARQEGVLHV